MESPKTLLEAIQFFSDAENCRQFMIAIRWDDGVVRCPQCGAEATYMEKSKLYFCKVKHPKQKFSLKVGTIFEDSPIGLDKWLPAFWLVSNCKNGVSSYEIARALGVTQKSAWFMAHRIREALKQDNALLGEGPVEVDEVFLGGKPSNMHADKGFRNGQEILKGERKTVVLGMLDRGSREVRAKVIPNAKRETLQKEILAQVGFGSTVYTDGWKGYSSLERQKFVHETVSHMNEYVRGQVHTQGIENFWSCLKRGLTGTYVAVEPFHMDAYVDEQVFRFNNRKLKDGARFKKAVGQVVGKRLTYAQVTGRCNTNNAGGNGEGTAF